MSICILAGELHLGVAFLRCAGLASLYCEPANLVAPWNYAVFAMTHVSFKVGLCYIGGSLLQYMGA